ncbi:MAG TPA: hypothetical protein VF450_02270, partial [Noviherbaspirillum sp.]
VLVTVSVSIWSFDRPIRTIVPLRAEHHGFAWTATSKIVPPCPHAPFAPCAELTGSHKENPSKKSNAPF